MGVRDSFSVGRSGPDGAVAGALVGCLIVVIAVNVALRTLGLPSLVWSIEFVEQVFPWIVFVGGAAAFRMRKEIVVDSLFAFLPPQARIVLMTIALVATVLVAGVMAVVGVALVIKLAPQDTMLLQISLGWRTAALPVGMSLIFVFALSRLISFLVSAKARAEEISPAHHAAD